jgi:hypothetical protein
MIRAIVGVQAGVAGTAAKKVVIIIGQPFPNVRNSTTKKDDTEEGMDQIIVGATLLNPFVQAMTGTARTRGQSSLRIRMNPAVNNAAQP